MSGLHQAALMGNVEILKLLLENGALVDIKDCRGMRPLHYACWQGRPRPVEILLQWNSSVNEQAREGETPLHLACQHGHYDVVCIVAEGGPHRICAEVSRPGMTVVGIQQHKFKGDHVPDFPAQHHLRTAVDSTNLLLHYHANVTIRNRQHKTPLDLACEFGRYKVVDLLLSSNRCVSLLEESPQDMVDNHRTTCLHLAAKNGHTDIVRLLLKAGIDINRSTLNGTSLHEASLCGKIDVVRVLLQSGIDVNRTNSYDQSALDIVKKFTTTGAAKEMKQMLREAIHAVQARAITDLYNPCDPQGLAFKEGELISVLEQNEDGRWKGVIFGDQHTSRTGYFPATAVVLLDRPVGGMQRSTKPTLVKKVPPPIVPDVANRKSGSSYSSGYSSSNTIDRSSYGSMGADDTFPPPPSPHKDSCDHGPQIYSGNNANVGESSPSQPFPPYNFSNQQHAYTHVIVASRNNPSQPGSPMFQEGPMFTQPHLYERFAPVYQQQASLEDQGIDMQSPGRDSPGSSGSSGSGGGSGSTGCRNSTTSLDSGRASSSAYDGKMGPGLVACTQHRLSGQSYESSGSLRHSYHSSSSSLGSMDEGHATCQLNVGELLAAGYPDHEILNRWLTELHFDEYYQLFVQAGYDMPTISRMTPEDLTAIGITKPGHRKKLKAEIARLNISDGLPTYIPNTLEEWLHVLHLEEYEHTLRQQGYHTVEQVTDVAWEDLEEIGIKKLGHQKKVMLAIKRVKDILSGVRRFSIDPRNPNHQAMTGDGMPIYSYPPQEVAITTPRPPTSPSSEGLTQPELTTFQQSPTAVPRGSDIFRYDTMGPGSPLHHVYRAEVGMGSPVHHPYRPHMGPPVHMGGSPSHMLYRPDFVAIHVRHPSGARSLENLESEREGVKVPHNYNNPSVAAEPRLYDGMMTWRRGSYDDGDLTPTNETMVMYEVEGGGTLPRPKVSVKPRPVAKIVAKTRRVCNDSAMDIIYTEQEVDCKAVVEREVCSSTGVDLPNHGSPRHVVMGSPHGTLGRGKKTPPPPPKRTNSIKNDRNSIEKNMEATSEQAFANCVKSLASKFSIPTHDDDLPPPPPPKEEVTPAPVPEDFPPPPSPMLDHSEDSTPTAASTPLDTVELRLGAASPSQQADSDCELPQHPKRNDSNSSFDSSSSTDSNISLPFANENVGTIKQRAIKPHPPLTMVELNRSPRLSPVLNRTANQSGSKTSASPPPKPVEEVAEPPEDEYDDETLQAKRPQDTGDVLNDIGNMLADLTDELDAMLENELQTQ